MKNFIFTIFILINSSVTFAADATNYIDTSDLNTRAMVYMESKVKNINFKTCDEEIIIAYLNKYFNNRQEIGYKINQ